VLQSERLPAEASTLAERLQAADYRTWAVVSNFVLRDGEGFDQGFDVYDDRMDEEEANRRSPERIASGTTDAALRALAALGEEKSFFLWVHYQDPHGPYTPPERLLSEARDPRGHDRSATERRHLRVNPDISGDGGIPVYQALPGIAAYSEYVARYDAEIRYFDEELGRLLAAIDAARLPEAPVIVITSDHGEGMGEHDYYFAHGDHLYDTLLHVPLVLRAPGVPPAVREEPVQHLDLVPTVLELAGLAVPPALPGVSLLHRPAAGREERMISAQLRRRVSVRSGNLKLILEGDRVQLFDLASDPGEERDLVRNRHYAPARRKLLVEARRLRRELAALPAPSSPQRTEDERRKLEALGYVD
jgi:arylsulfatase A-like enzyme